MIIGFGFGNLWVSLIMLIATSLISYGLFSWMNKKRRAKQMSAVELRRYYYEMRRQAKDMSEQFDLTDDEIEARIQKELSSSLGDPPIK